MAARFDLVVTNGTLVSAEGRRQADIAIAAGTIAELGPHGAFDADEAERVDAGGLFILPGLVDGHVHFREPGLEHKEDWLTGSRAAVFGGVTTVLEMPNTVPPTRTAADAEAKLGQAEAKAYCDFGLFGLLDAEGVRQGSVPDLIGSGLIVGLKVFLGPTTGDLSAPADEQLVIALELARRAGLRTAFHAEDAMTIRASGGSRPVEAEVRAIDHAGRLLSRGPAAGHILHLSSADGIDAVRRWRSRGVDLTCEVTPHHLFLGGGEAEALAGMGKVYPPIRGEPHASALIAALADGSVDCVASDHAPHSPAEKLAPDVREVPAGVPGVETLLPLLLTAVDSGRISLERLIEVSSTAPARAWGLWPRKGALELGADADLAIVELGREGVLRGADLHGRHPITPFAGRTLQGAVVATIVRGRLVMRDGELRSAPGWGRDVARRAKLNR